MRECYAREWERVWDWPHQHLQLLCWTSFCVEPSQAWSWCAPFSGNSEIMWEQSLAFPSSWSVPKTCITVILEGVLSEKAMAPHSSTLAWKILRTEEPGRLRSMGSRMTERLPFHFSLSCTGEGNGNPLQCSCLENPRDWGAWWAAVYRVAQSRTQLKQLNRESRERFFIAFLPRSKHLLISWLQSSILYPPWF